MKILWICNLVLPSFSCEYNIKKSVYGGWIESLLCELEIKEDIDISLAFPIIDVERQHDGFFNNHRYYYFDGKMDSGEYNSIFVTDFIRIFELEKPDVIHIWGTEYNHARAAVEAADELNAIGRVLIDIQGICGYIVLHYALGLTEKNICGINAGISSIEEEISVFSKKGENERILLNKVLYVTGRTEWDRAICRQINSKLIYFKNHRVLRKVFYSRKGEWKVSNCRKHSLFITNGSYAVKGFHIFLKALRIVVGEYPDTVCCVGGNDLTVIDEATSTQYGNYIKDMINRFDLQGRLSFCGNIDENKVAEQMLKANAFISSSVIENCSNSISEAMMLGVPVVASFVGGVNDQIIHTENGYLYQADAYYMLAHYIITIFENDDIATELSIHATSAAVQRHNLNVIAQNAEKIYKQICAN